jgi:hypothetical protein
VARDTGAAKKDTSSARHVWRRRLIDCMEAIMRERNTNSMKRERRRILVLPFRHCEGAKRRSNPD